MKGLLFFLFLCSFAESLWAIGDYDPTLYRRESERRRMCNMIAQNRLCSGCEAQSTALQSLNHDRQMCQVVVNSRSCQNFLSQSDEFKNDKASCSYAEVCSHRADNSSELAAQGCWNLGVKVTKSALEAAKSAWSCGTDINCIRQLAPTARQAATTAATAGICFTSPILCTRMYGRRIVDAGKGMISGLWEDAKKDADTFTHLRCLKPIVAAQYQCYLLIKYGSFFVGAGGAVKATAGMAKMARLERVLHPERATARATTQTAARTARRPWLVAGETRTALKKRMQSFDPVDDNRRMEMINLVNSSSARGTKIVDVENSILKGLNSEIADQDLVTALTNQHKQILDHYMQEFAQKHKGLIDVKQYSDFKSQRFALIPKTAQARATGIPPSVLNELNDIFAKSNREFADYVKGMNVSTKTPPEQWFRGGVASSADDANLMARVARNQGSQNNLLSIDTPGVDLTLRRSFTQLEKSRYQLTRDIPSSSPLMTSVDGARVLRPEVFDLIKKSDGDIESLRSTIRSSYPGVNVSPETAAKMMRYADETDQFQPGIWQSSRQFATVAEGRNGALTIDVGGMGARNAYRTALEAARCSVPGQLTKCVRTGERIVTRDFQEELAKIRDISLANCRSNNLRCSVRISGDDIVVIPENGPLPANFARNNLQQINQSIGEARVRQSEISPGVSSAVQRVELAKHAESYEKILRNRLRESSLSPRAQNMTFSIRMRGNASGQGALQVQFTGSGVNSLSAQERAALRNYYREALEELNRKNKSAYTLSY